MSNTECILWMTIILDIIRYITDMFIKVSRMINPLTTNVHTNLGNVKHRCTPWLNSIICFIDESPGVQLFEQVSVCSSVTKFTERTLAHDDRKRVPLAIGTPVMKILKQIRLKILADAPDGSYLSWKFKFPSIMKICWKKSLFNSYYRDFIFKRK